MRVQCCCFCLSSCEVKSYLREVYARSFELDVALTHTPYAQDVEHHKTTLVLKTKEYFIYEHISITYLSKKPYQ